MKLGYFMQRLLCSIATIKQAEARKKVALNMDYQFKNFKTFKKDLVLNSSKKTNLSNSRFHLIFSPES